jgi:hypothetical protein
LERKRAQHRARGGREDEAPSTVPEPGPEELGARSEPPLDPERFAHPADDHVGGDAGVGAQSSPRGPKDSERVHLVHDECRTVRITEPPDSREIRNVPIHSEVALRHDPAHPLAVGQGALEGVQVAMGQDHDRRPTQPTSVDDGGVVQTIRKHCLAGAGERADSPHVCGIAAGEEQAGLGAEPIRELSLELQMLRMGAGNQP